MQWFKRFAAIAVLLVVSIAVVAFVLENQGWSGWPSSVPSLLNGLWLSISLLPLS